MRVSSVMSILPSCSSIDTLKSTRTSTRLPRTSRSRSESLAILVVLLLVIVLDGICRFIVAQTLRAIRKLAEKADKHLHDSRELLFWSDNLLLGREFAH